jgi:hypothetical protein
MGTFWQGTFVEGEFIVRVVDERGKVIRRVEMLVEDNGGRPAYYYPVSNFTPRANVVSDADGTLVFYHIKRPPPEFGGNCRYVFFLYPIGDQPPVYNCVFVRDGRRIGKVAYHVLERKLTMPYTATKYLPHKRIHWEWSEEDMEKLPWFVKPSGEVMTEELEFPVYEGALKLDTG